MSMPTVLVVDDDPAINKLVQTQLGLLGFQALSCDSIASAKRSLTSQPAFAFVLSDINMPGGSGLELASWINKEHHGLPMYLMTGQSIDSMKEALKENNVLDVLFKPFQIRDLIAMLATRFEHILTPPLYPANQVNQVNQVA